MDIENSYDYVFSIPYGKKYYLSFSYESGNHVAILQDKKKTFHSKISMCYSKSLLGMTLQGTIINNKYFIIQDICYYKYKPFKQNNKQKLIILNNLFNHYKELVFNRLIIKMPMIDTNLEKLITRLDHLNINNYGVAFCMWSHNMYKILKYERLNTKVFKIRAGIKSDQYYQINNNNERLLIPSYKISKWMNTLFRRIKENENLDYIQESDDEDDFENNNEDKWLQKDVELDILCYLNNKFMMWVPKQLVHSVSSE